MQQPKYKMDLNHLEHLWERMRSPERIMHPERLGAARLTRYSFARTFIRHAVRNKWKVEITSWQLDAQGRGEAVYTIRTHERDLRFVVFSDKLPEEERTDRVIATAWDVTAVLCEGELDEARLEIMRQEVPRQRHTQLDSRNLVWTRANRSSRFFDYVVDCLAAGEQPDPHALNDAGYILRSTAFYANGKLGTASFGDLGGDHPVGDSYHAQMLAAWLLREFSYDLAEHCAYSRSPHAARLQGDWRRFFGIGNATGLGLVRFVFNQPLLLNAWCTLRELALAHATGAEHRSGDPEVERMLSLMERGIHFFEERAGMYTGPFDSGRELAAQLTSARQYVEEFAEQQTLGGETTRYPWQKLYEWAEHKLDVEGQELLNGLLIELYDDLDDALEKLFIVHPSPVTTLGVSIEQLRYIIEHDYSWVFDFDFQDPDSNYYFWYFSINKNEPRRGILGLDRGGGQKQPIDIARRVQQLYRELDDTNSSSSIDTFLSERPQYSGIIERVLSTRCLPYAEIYTNPLGANFLPLYLQKFQLAMYGMENYNPKSTDWLRVTLLQGAPRAKDVEAGEEGEWSFPLKPAKAAEAC